jgi:hypothetical protein
MLYINSGRWRVIIQTEVVKVSLLIGKAEHYCILYVAFTYHTFCIPILVTKSQRAKTADLVITWANTCIDEIPRADVAGWCDYITGGALILVSSASMSGYPGGLQRLWDERGRISIHCTTGTDC